MSATTWTLKEHPEQLCIWRLDPDASVPGWVWETGDFLSITRTEDELSVVCSAEHAGEVEDVVGPYSAFVIDEQLDFGLTGVMSALLEPIAEAEISILALSTYDTDWILVPTDEADAAVAAWRRRGHSVRRA